MSFFVRFYQTFGVIAIILGSIFLVFFCIDKFNLLQHTKAQSINEQTTLIHSTNNPPSQDI